MWLTASAWLSAALLDALEEPTPPGSTPALEAALSQGGPLDAMPPGPVLTAFLAEASAPAAPTELTPPADPAEASPAANSAQASPPAGAVPENDALGLHAALDPDSNEAPSPSAAVAPADGPPSYRSGGPDSTPTPLEAQPAAPDSVAARIASGAGLAQCGDNALLGLIRGWRRVASLAAAAELAAVSEFSRRRHDQAKADGAWDSTAIDAADVELAAALTLTTRSTQLLMDRAAMLHELPATATALAAGRIDWPRALVLINGLAGQDPSFARRIEDQLIGRAPQQTTGQLRAALDRALLAADPEAADRRRQAEERHARIERGPEPGGVTALLAGRCLPVTDTVTAWNRITSLARQLRATGADGSLDELRVHVYLALLNGQAITAPAADSSLGGHSDSPPPGRAESPPPGRPDPPAPTHPQSETPNQPASDELQPHRLTGHINLTVPLSNLAGLSNAPGHLGGFGPVTGFAARKLANCALGEPGVRWCITVTGDQGQAIGHGCATRARPIGARAAPGQSGWLFTVKLSALAGADCDHNRESPHYRPPPSLWHLVQARNVCCSAPGCRIAASACDDDHTVPFDRGGRTCECNLGPLCRWHHRVKQARGWRLEQPEPGVFTWTMPSGRVYTTGPTEHVV